MTSTSELIARADQVAAECEVRENHPDDCCPDFTAMLRECEANLRLAARAFTGPLINDALKKVSAAIDRLDVKAEAKSQEPDAVAIKPLEWVDNDSERVGSRAQTILGEYVTWISEDECCYLQLASQFKGHPHGASIDAAKAAAQADYEQRIRSALIHPTTKPEAPAVSVDAETIDAVARIIDPTAWKMEHGYWMEQARAYEAISKATAIAALISRGR